MKSFLLYAGEGALCAGLFYGYYCLLLRSSRLHRWNRYYLLSAVFLSLLIPLLKIPLAAGSSGNAFLQYTSQLNAAGVHWLAPVTIGPQNRPDYNTFLAALYLLVAAVMTGRLAAGYAGMIRRIRRAAPHSGDSRFTIIPSTDENGPYSFFRYIFWNSYVPVESLQGQQMLRHELTHVSERHSVDRLLMEAVCGILWINPFFWLIKKELAMVHEFSADKKAAAGGEPGPYAELILMKAIGASRQDFHYMLANNFFHPPIKRRLYMLMRNNHSRFTWLRKTGILPIALCTLVFFGCQNRAENTATQPDITQIKPEDIASLSVQKAQHLLTIKLKNGKTITVPDSVLPPPPPPPAPGASGAGKGTISADGSMVFTWVEHMPRFPGTTNDESSQQKILQYLSTHIVYPAVARDDDIQGTVYTQFLVAPDGSIRDVRTVNSHLGGGLEEEAVNVIREMPRWIPGQQNGRPVMVQFAIPVKFALE